MKLPTFGTLFWCAAYLGSILNGSSADVAQRRATHAYNDLGDHLRLTGEAR